uniref:Uncharacterized protein n=1 Tax=Klebsiella pneumoniae TaxID=573 RepID=A0A3G1IDU7_KLEPN|nr:hypothetical protein pPUTH1_0092 [Klebsiella pneumoniae]
MQYMPARLVCIGVAYADDWHMRMSALCRCAEYGYAVHILFSHFSTADPKNTTAGGGCLNLRFSEITGTDGRSAGKRLQKKSPWARKWKWGKWHEGIK